MFPFLFLKQTGRWRYRPTETISDEASRNKGGSNEGLDALCEVFAGFCFSSLTYVPV